MVCKFWVLKNLKGQAKEEEVEAWLVEHREIFQGMSEKDLEVLREQADYDKQAWEEILKQIKDDADNCSEGY